MNRNLSRLESTLIDGLSASRKRVDAGGFATFITPGDATPWMNYAVPLADFDVDAMAQLFRAHDRMPRVEFLADLHPELRALLSSSGFEVELEAPVMTLNRGDWVHYGNGTAVDATAQDAALLASVTDVAFGGASTAVQIQSTADGINANRTLASLVYCEGRPVSAGFAIGSSQVREVAGIATLPEFRRRGYAGAVIANLLERFFAAGGEVAWLTPGDEGAQALYTKLGFRPTGTQINMSLQHRPVEPV